MELDDLSLSIDPVCLSVDFQHLRDVFYRMGLSDKDIVALSGGHTLV